MLYIMCILLISLYFYSVLVNVPVDVSGINMMSLKKYIISGLSVLILPTGPMEQYITLNLFEIMYYVVYCLKVYTYTRK